MADKISIDLTKAGWIGGATYEDSPQGLLASFPPSGGAIVLTGESMGIGGADWTGVTHIVLEATGLLAKHDLSVYIEFREFADYRAGNSCGVHIGALPECRTQLVIDLDALDSQHMHLERTKGRLKAGVSGRGMDIASARLLSISLHDSYCAQQIIVHGLELYKGKPEIAYNPGKLVDSLGQYKRYEWKGKTKSIEEMSERLNKELAGCADEPRFAAGRSRYGGDLATKWEATGYFHTHYDGKRWYLVDPEGYRFVSAGLDCARPDEDSYINDIEELFDELPDKARYADAYLTDAHGHNGAISFNHAIYNMMRVFGADWKQKWMKLTHNRLIRWGYNTIGNWSDLEFIRYSKMPYVWPLEGFPGTKDNIFRDFPDVFSEEYAQNSKKFAEQLKEFNGDANMIGYFLRNEPQWAFVNNLMIAEKVFETPYMTACKAEFIKRLKAKYGGDNVGVGDGGIGKLNKAWNKQYSSYADLESPQIAMASFSPEAYADAEKFSEDLIRLYVSAPSAACKAVDPHHMNLGMRYAFITYPMLTVGSDCFDVFSINCYQDDPYKAVLEAGELTNMPVLVGEFHFGAMDVGMFSTGQNGVMTQRERGLAYRVYFERGLNCPYFLGAHNFILNDQALLGRWDGENMQIGCVDVCQNIYDEYVDETIKVNEEIYALADGKRTMPCPKIQRIPRVGF